MFRYTNYWNECHVNINFVYELHERTSTDCYIEVSILKLYIEHEMETLWYFLYVCELLQYSYLYILYFLE